MGFSFVSVVVLPTKELVAAIVGFEMCHCSVDWGESFPTEIV